MTQAWERLRVVEGSCEVTQCDCCGQDTWQVNGDIEALEGAWIAFYWVRFSPAHPEAYPVFRFGTGDWRDSAQDDARWVFGVEYDQEQSGVRLMDLSQERGDVRATYLDRADVIDTPFAQEAFAMFDAVFMGDRRLESLHNDA